MKLSELPAKVSGPAAGKSREGPSKEERIAATSVVGTGL